MVEDDRAYFSKRAAAEAELAQKAAGPSAAEAHRRLAEAYRQRLEGKARNQLKTA